MDANMQPSIIGSLIFFVAAAYFSIPFDNSELLGAI